MSSPLQRTYFLITLDYVNWTLVLRDDCRGCFIPALPDDLLHYWKHHRRSINVKNAVFRDNSFNGCFFGISNSLLLKKSPEGIDRVHIRNDTLELPNSVSPADFLSPFIETLRWMTIYAEKSAKPATLTLLFCSAVLWIFVNDGLTLIWSWCLSPTALSASAGFTAPICPSPQPLVNRL